MQIPAQTLAAYLSQDGKLLEAVNALLPTRSWLALSPNSQLLLLLKAAAFCLPQEQTCWGGRFPTCLPGHIAQDLEWPLRDKLTAAQVAVADEGDRIWQVYQQLLDFTQQLVTGQAVSWPPTSAEVGGFVATLVSSCWKQLECWVGEQHDYRQFVEEEWLPHQQGRPLQAARKGYDSMMYDLQEHPMVSCLAMHALGHIQHAC
jgi:hypothetical protein